MYDFSDTIVNSSVVVGLIFLILIFIYQTETKHRKANLLIFGLVLALVGQFIFATTLIYTKSNLTISMAKAARDLFFGFFYFFIYLHYEALSRDKPDPWIRSIFTTIIVIFTGLTITWFLDPSDMFVNNWYFRLRNIIGLACFTYALYISLFTWLKLHEKESFFETFAFFIIFIAHIIYVLGDNTYMVIFNNLGGYESIADFIATLGVFLFVFIYIFNINYLYRLPVPIHQIIVYNEAGLPLYSRSVRTKGIPVPEIHDMLFAGAVTAISSLMHESFGSITNLRQIDAESIQIYFMHKFDFTIVIIVSKGTKFLLQSLMMLNQLIAKDHYPAITEQSIINTNVMQEKIDNYIRIAFPYIQIISSEKK